MGKICAMPRSVVAAQGASRPSAETLAQTTPTASTVATGIISRCISWTDIFWPYLEMRQSIAK